MIDPEVHARVVVAVRELGGRYVGRPERLAARSGINLDELEDLAASLKGEPETFGLTLYIAGGVVHALLANT
jgi:hypothetical protein